MVEVPCPCAGAVSVATGGVGKVPFQATLTNRDLDVAGATAIISDLAGSAIRLGLSLDGGRYAVTATELERKGYDDVKRFISQLVAIVRSSSHSSVSASTVHPKPTSTDKPNSWGRATASSGNFYDGAHPAMPTTNCNTTKEKTTITQ